MKYFHAEMLHQRDIKLYAVLDSEDDSGAGELEVLDIAQHGIQIKGFNNGLFCPHVFNGMDSLVEARIFGHVMTISCAGEEQDPVDCLLAAGVSEQDINDVAIQYLSSAPTNEE